MAFAVHHVGLYAEQAVAFAQERNFQFIEDALADNADDAKENVNPIPQLFFSESGEGQRPPRSTRGIFTMLLDVDPVSTLVEVDEEVDEDLLSSPTTDDDASRFDDQENALGLTGVRLPKMPSLEQATEEDRLGHIEGLLNVDMLSPYSSRADDQWATGDEDEYLLKDLPAFTDAFMDSLELTEDEEEMEDVEALLNDW